VACDGQEPGAKGPRSPESGELGVGFNERFLRCVLSGLVVAEDAPGGGMDMALVAPNEIGIGLASAGEHFADEMIVGLHRLWFERRHIYLDDGRR
jgi:hypothetical protein